MTDTIAPDIAIRAPRPGEQRLLHRFADMAVGEVSTQFRQMVDQVCETGKNTNTEAELDRSSTRERRPQPVLYRLVVAERRGKTIGMSYTANPMSWAQTLQDWPIDDLNIMLARINEIQVLAVEPRHRRKGIAGHLLADAEQALRDTGHRLAMVCLRGSGDYARLTAWYSRRGYTFGPGSYDQPSAESPLWRFQPRTDHDRRFDFVRGAMRAHATGFKSLHPAVTVQAAHDQHPPTVTGLLDEA